MSLYKTLNDLDIFQTRNISEETSATSYKSVLNTNRKLWTNIM